MKKLFIIFAFFSNIIVAQMAFNNFGNIQIHDQGQIGFHINLENNGTFNKNLGLAGFYSTTNTLNISGTKIPQFNNMEVAVNDNLFLNINTEVTNNLSFISGYIVTPRDSKNISIDFLNNALNVLENNLRHTDGYASYKGNNAFTFPIGDDNKLRPLITPFQSGDPKFSAAYFNEDANNPTTFSTNFNTNISEATIKKISISEFWDFNSDTKTQVTLTWDQESNIENLVSNLNDLRIVGWNKNENKWLDLGNFKTTGTITKGTITSESFIPNSYEIITFGSLIDDDDLIVHNTFTPNGDNENETFTIPGIELFDNTLEVYNRWGRLVYNKVNYKNDWDGLSNNEYDAFDKNQKIPVGTYFYILNLTKSNKQYSGWIYVTY